MAISLDHFPRLKSPTRAEWAPVVMAPIMGSPEQLVIGVAAVSPHSVHIERANMLRRLECLYGKSAETLIFAAQVALDELEVDLRERGIAALAQPKKTFSGVSIGEIANGEGNTIAELCRSWMAALSSLYSAATLELMAARPSAPAIADALTTTSDRLPSLVLQYVTNVRPGLEDFFSLDVRQQRVRRQTTRVHNVIIDFAGSHIVANFGTLLASHHAASVDKIKRRMFDLIVERHTQVVLGSRAHEMIVQHPASDDPQVTDRQAAMIQDGLEALKEQSSREQITLVPMTSVPEIGNHILAAEQRMLG